MDLYAMRMAAEQPLNLNPDNVSDNATMADLGIVNTHEHPYYWWKRDFTYAGIPLFLSSFIIKGQKKGFRSARFDFQDHFKTTIDNYTQFAPYPVIVALNALGYRGRSDWLRLGANALFSNALMALFVNATKYSVKELRPDNSTKNSFPSGHTATAFVAATILHKEFGTTRSPWFSIGGYTLATATGIMRVLNNRHWISDVMAGAGIGIISTELGYFLGDVLFREKGILRYDNFSQHDPNHPHFFDVQMGIATHCDEIAFPSDDPSDPSDVIKLGTSTVFGIESAYFLNKYFGIGWLARVTSTPAKGLNFSDDEYDVIAGVNNVLSTYQDNQGRPLPGIYNTYVNDNNFVDISLDLGVHFNLPISKHFRAGAKILAGYRLTHGVRYKARNGNPKIDGTYCITDGKITTPLYWFVDGDGKEFLSNPILQANVAKEYNMVLENQTEEYDLIKVTCNNSFNVVGGLSFTYYYNDNFAWKIFADFDTTKNKYTYNGKYFSDEALDRMRTSTFPQDHPEMWKAISEGYTSHAERRFNLFTFGGAFTVSF